MKIVILGAGMIGVHIARELIQERRDIVIIEKDPEAARTVGNELDCIVINDDGSRPEVLRQAGIDKAAWFLALTGSDEVNMVSCGLVAAESRNVRTIARVDNSFYSTLSPQQRKVFGLTVTVNPAQEAADTVARIIDEGFAEDVIPLHEGRLQLRHVEARQANGFSGKTLSQIKSSISLDFLVAAAVREGIFDIPSGDFLVQEDDWLYLLGKPEDLDAILGQVVGIKQSAKRILIVGATSICDALISRLQNRSAGIADFAQRLLGKNRSITVLDTSREEGKRLTRSHQGIEVLHGDGSEDGVLESAGIESADLVVCATESQTYNIMTAQLAKHLGARKSVAITLNDRYAGLFESLDVDALVSIKDAFAVKVLELVRKGHIKTIHGFFEDDVEIVELGIGPQSPAAGKKLKELNLPKGALAAFIIKGVEIVVPTGSTELHEGDVVAFILRKDAIAALEESFGGALGD